MRRGEVWWADLGAHRPQEQTGRRPVVIWQSDTLSRVLQSIIVVPLTTNLDRAKLAGTAVIAATEGCLPADSVALAFQLRAIPRTALQSKIRALTEAELAELELATDEIWGRLRRMAELRPALVEQEGVRFKVTDAWREAERER